MLDKADVSKLNYSSNGSPWARIEAKLAVVSETLQYSGEGSPWYGVGEAVAPPGGNIASWDSIPFGSIKTFGTITTANTKTINSITV